MDAYLDNLLAETDSAWVENSESGIIMPDKQLLIPTEDEIIQATPDPVQEFSNTTFDWPYLGRIEKFAETDPFREAAFTFEKYGVYTREMPGTKAFEDFWKVEDDRIANGMTNEQGVRITGSHYFFLNYHPFQRLDRDTHVDEFGLPYFWGLHYDFFHALEAAEKILANLFIVKPRQTGFSELMSAIGSRHYTMFPRSRQFFLGYKEGDLINGGILDKVWENLDFLREHTEIGLLPQLKNTAWERIAGYYDQDTNIPKGTKAKIYGRIVHHPRNVRGLNGQKIYFEEMGSWPMLIDVLTASLALVASGSIKRGMLLGWGTGGEEGPGIAALKEVFYNPIKWGAMPFDDKYGDSKGKLSYFFPVECAMMGNMDNDGNPDVVTAKEYHDKNRQARIEDPLNYTKYSAEFPYNAEEALTEASQSDFNKFIINQQIKFMDTPGAVPLEYRTKRGTMEIERNLKGQNTLVFKKTIDGPVHIIQEPQRGPDGQVINHLYVAGLDSIDKGKKESADSTKGSDLCLTIKKRKFGVSDPYEDMYVCCYKFRPDFAQDGFKQVLRLILWYNAQVNLEDTRRDVYNFSRKVKMTGFFMKRPAAVRPGSAQGETTQIGTQATTTTNEIMDQRVHRYVEDHGHKIWLRPLLDDLKGYRKANRGAYDAVVAMGLTELADEEMMHTPPKVVPNAGEVFEHFGKYRDSQGRMRYGRFPVNKPGELQGLKLSNLGIRR